MNLILPNCGISDNQVKSEIYVMDGSTLAELPRIDKIMIVGNDSMSQALIE